MSRFHKRKSRGRPKQPHEPSSSVAKQPQVQTVLKTVEVPHSQYLDRVGRARGDEATDFNDVKGDQNGPDAVHEQSSVNGTSASRTSLTSTTTAA